MTLIGVALMMMGPYEAGELKWRAEREASLKAPRGWLSVSGLTWLKPGVNTVGAAEENDVRLPDYAEARFGQLIRLGNQVRLVRARKPDQELKTDADGQPDRISVGDAVFTVIKRGDRLGVRLYDPHSKAQREFKSLAWYPVDPAYRVEAKFTPYAKPKLLKIVNVIGDVAEVPSPGYVEFTLGGKPVRLDAQGEGDELFFNFQDATSAKETYGAGRFLNTPMPKDGKVIMDFNRLTNPPCAYTDFATCPRPPDGSRLTISVRAGEKTPPNHG